MNGEIMMKNMKLVEKKVLDEVSLPYFIKMFIYHHLIRGCGGNTNYLDILV